MCVLSCASALMRCAWFDFRVLTLCVNPGAGPYMARRLLTRLIANLGASASPLRTVWGSLWGARGDCCRRSWLSSSPPPAWWITWPAFRRRWGEVLNPLVGRAYSEGATDFHSLCLVPSSRRRIYAKLDSD
jgi:hypothetical protein